MTAALLLVVIACDSDDDTPNELQEQIDEGDVDQVEDDLEDKTDQKEEELDQKD